MKTTLRSEFENRLRAAQFWIFAFLSQSSKAPPPPGLYCCSTNTLLKQHQTSIETVVERKKIVLMEATLMLCVQLIKGVENV